MTMRTVSVVTLSDGLARVDVLVLDDWGLAAVKEVHRHDLLEMLDDRAGSRSTVITTQLPRDRWYDYLGDPTVADAIHSSRACPPDKRLQ